MFKNPLCLSLALFPCFVRQWNKVIHLNISELVPFNKDLQGVIYNTMMYQVTSIFKRFLANQVLRMTLKKKDIRTCFDSTFTFKIALTCFEMKLKHHYNNC